MEFVMTTDLSVMNPSELVFNYHEIESYIIQRTERYRNLLVEEDDLANAKTDRANLRKLATALNDQKISVKKAFMKPYDEFESKIKRLIALCDEPAKNIDEQIKAFEAAAKAKKKAELATHFNEHASYISEYVSFEDVFDPKWLNATVKLDVAKQQIEEICERYANDVEALNGICESVDTATALSLKRCYKATKSISRVVQTKAEIERELRTLAERKAAEEAARKEKEVAETVAPPVEEKNEPIPFEPEPQEMAFEETVEVSFKVTCTKAKLALLKRFLVENGITYGKA